MCTRRATRRTSSLVLLVLERALPVLQSVCPGKAGVGICPKAIDIIVQSTGFMVSLVSLYEVALIVY
jgi:hypothetical protein